MADAVFFAPPWHDCFADGGGAFFVLLLCWTYVLWCLYACYARFILNDLLASPSATAYVSGGGTVLRIVRGRAFGLLPFLM